MRVAALTGVLLMAATAAWAAPGPQVAGVFAMPGGTPGVTASLLAASGQGAGRQTLDVAMTRSGTSKPITRYDVELSKRLHLIAVSADLRDFVHEHAERPDAAGHFHVAMSFPHAGLWHVYADAVPTGLPQQVLRFELDLGGTPNASPPPTASGLEAKDGRYGARFETLELRAGQEAKLDLTLLRDGQAAPDVTPFLGVAAHAVFIGVADLSYLHAHAAPAMDAAMSSGAMPGMDMPMAMRPMAAGTHVEPKLALHVEAPRPGSYALWIQFTAGGAVRTVPFVVKVE